MDSVKTQARRIETRQTKRNTGLKYTKFAKEHRDVANPKVLKVTVEHRDAYLRNDRITQSLHEDGQALRCAIRLAVTPNERHRAHQRTKVLDDGGELEGLQMSIRWT